MISTVLIKIDQESWHREDHFSLNQVMILEFVHPLLNTSFINPICGEGKKSSKHRESRVNKYFIYFQIGQIEIGKVTKFGSDCSHFEDLQANLQWEGGC